MEKETPNDYKLAKYKFEIETEYNDGWTKEHYKKLYEDRLSQLLREDIKHKTINLDNLGLDPWTSSNMES